MSRIACDFCRRKKAKCSRELPKCAACRPWPGDCVYSKKSKQEATPLPTAEGKYLQDSLPSTGPVEKDEIYQRLQGIELALEKLTVSVNRVLGGSVTSSTPASSSSRLSPAPRRQTHISDNDKPQLIIEKAHSFASLDRASRDLEVLSSEANSLQEQQSASTGLQDLSRALTTVDLEEHKGYDDETEVQSGFFVPTKAVGYGLMGRFLQILELGDVMTTKPSDEVLNQVIFEPDVVKQRGWVVYVNFILLSLAVTDSTLTHFAKSFRHNTRLALNDASIFLEPNEVNIQALFLLSCHGEEYASPNLSWMLTGHACRQIQALGFYSPGNPNKQTYEEQQRRLALFWALFMIDKSCSLAFGRPTFLPMPIYQHVPLPDFRYMKRYRPHQDSSQTSATQGTASTFGAHFFMQSIKLAKVIGEVLEFLAPNAPVSTAQLLESKLQSWDAQTVEVLSASLDSEASGHTTDQIHEMSVGMRTMKFQYLHVLILLLREEDDYHDRCVDLSREAVSLLPEMVSNWSQVYNGVVWQLLYYPFTPFLTIFGHVIRHRSAITTTQDLDFLDATVVYFRNMKAQMHSLTSVTSKLEKTAEIFANLARFIISKNTKAMQMELNEDDTAINSNYDILDGVSSEAYTESFADYVHTQGLGDFAVADLNVEGLLNCLVEDAAPSESRGRKRPFETAFDWFSWESQSQH